jgi:hypothetical protein
LKFDLEFGKMCFHNDSPSEPIDWKKIGSETSLKNPIELGFRVFGFVDASGAVHSINKPLFKYLDSRRSSKVFANSMTWMLLTRTLASLT